jgi:hypothetical protein
MSMRVELQYEMISAKRHPPFGVEIQRRKNYVNRRCDLCDSWCGRSVWSTVYGDYCRAGCAAEAARKVGQQETGRY